MATWLECTLMGQQNIGTIGHCVVGANTVKFKNDQGHTWRGIGKRPDWLEAALAAGKTPKDLLDKS